MADNENAETGTAVPPLAGEDHVCAECRLAYREVAVEQAVAAITEISALVRQAVAALPEAARRVRPSPGLWSVAEYVGHLRDVFTASTIRLHRARTEDHPVVEPMLNDLRARRFRYNDWDLDAVLDELEATATGFRDEIARTRPDQWDRVVTRLPGEHRSARWVVRQAMHEGLHHLGDIRRTGQAVTPPG